MQTAKKQMETREFPQEKSAKSKRPSAYETTLAAFSENLKTLRGYRGLSHAKLSEALGVGTAQWIGRLEREPETASMEWVCRLSDYFSVTVPQMLTPGAFAVLKSPSAQSRSAK